ncbi:hypothetical protein MHA_2269 [Mannheimia haemolytica PHL213]|nr:hypothetical protein MHH_c28180 [Mannheimia haemolytica M42548]EDN75156.1 hypothetical protein MHA_2269 [Mannheimia haemolytica PHL213]EEY09070.1 hypothetical protein COI_2266 [Mannheimia haemolytica serotype A2 str. OVINE]
MTTILTERKQAVEFSGKFAKNFENPTACSSEKNPQNANFSFQSCPFSYIIIS